MAQSVARHYDRLAGVAAEQVTYSRGDDSVQLAAVPGNTRLEISDEYGATVETKATDFLVSADALVLAGVRAKPRVGDRIRMTLPEGRVQVFEVLDLAGGGHAEIDAHGLTWRIHTKQIDEEPS